MNNKIKSALFGILAILVVSVFMVSCEKEIDVNKEETNSGSEPAKMEASPEEMKELKAIAEAQSAFPDPVSNTYESLVERIKKSSEADGAVSGKSTASLVESVLNSEFLTMVYTRNDLQLGYEWFAEVHTGLKELTRRDDAAQAIYKKYQGMPVKGYSPTATLEEKGLYSFRVLFLEIMLSQESVLSSLPKSANSQLAKNVFDKMEAKSQDYEVYGFYSNLGSALILSRMLKLDGDSQFANASKTNEDLSKFIEKGHLLSPETVELIFSSGAQKYLDSE